MRPPRPGAVARFALWYSGRFLAANAQVLREVLTPGTGVRPVVVLVTPRARTDAELASFIALVGLTPGTLVVASRDERARDGGVELAVHTLHAPDPARARAALAELEDRLLAAWRSGSTRRSPRPHPEDP